MSSNDVDASAQAASNAAMDVGAAENAAIDLSGDGGVMKTILKAGTGWEKPRNGIEVAVHYTGTLLSGEKFDSSVDRGQLFRFELGQGRVIKGWDICVASMTRGEKCRVVLASDYAYGARGSPPKIPPAATLVFEIELFEFDNETDISTEKNGSLKKLETKSGSGSEVPEYDGVVTVEYSVELLDGTMCVAAKKETLTLGEETLPQGIQYAISTLHVGDAARFTVAPVQAYGLEGNDALKIPAGVTTIWNIELLELLNAPDPSTLEPTKKLEIANVKKTDGNTLFTQGKYERALKKYDLAASYTKFIPGEEGKLAQDLLNVCDLNAAQCLLKLTRFTDAQSRCNAVLVRDPNNVKGLYRRALAREALKLFPAAIEDLQQLLSVDAANQDASKMLAKIKAKVKAEEDKERAMYSKMFM